MSTTTAIPSGCAPRDGADLRARRRLTKSISKWRSGHQDSGPDRSPRAHRATACNAAQPREDGWGRAGVAAASPPPGRGDGHTRTLLRAEAARAQRPAEHDARRGCELAGERESGVPPRGTLQEPAVHLSRSWNQGWGLPGRPQSAPCSASRTPGSRLGVLRPRAPDPCAQRETVQGTPGRAMTKLCRLQQCPRPFWTNTDPLPPEPGACPPGHGAGPHSCLDRRSHSGKAQKQSQTRRTARGIRPARQDQEPAPGPAVPARAAV